MVKDENFSQDIGLDQVFMKDEKILEMIVAGADLKKTETVLEIGAGPGNLTKMLAERSKKVIAVEIDPKLKPSLTKQLRGTNNVRIVWGNALEVIEKDDVAFDKLVSNPPYSIAEPLIKALFKKKFKAAILTLPWRFVERLTANPEEDFFSKLSLLAQAFFRIETLTMVPADAWTPRPDTAGVVIRIVPFEAKSLPEIFLREFALQSDKKLKNALREAIIRFGSGEAKEKGTKRAAKNAIDDIGLPKNLLDKKISEMDLKEIRLIVKRLKGSFA
jgi:16S rRNA A1518/A1519 N6-dimethyltransferase RsmA/KsgA/DIM1 with predicted DNA glycosylase/AP lyase activity